MAEKNPEVPPAPPAPPAALPGGAAPAGDEPPHLKERRDFINRTFWVLGAAALYWALLAGIAVLRVRPVELPLFGPCEYSEIILFSLPSLGILLIGLHLAAHAYRGVARAGARHHGHSLRWRDQFPGVLGDDWEIPGTLAGLRVLVFFLFIVVPTGGYLFFAARVFSHLAIVQIDEVKRLPRPDEKLRKMQAPQAVEGKPLYLRWKLEGWRLLSPLPREAPSYLDSDWRWRSWREEWTAREEFDAPPNPEDLQEQIDRVRKMNNLPPSPTPAPAPRWTLQTPAGPGWLEPPAPKIPTEQPIPKTGGKTRVAITAVPFFEPWLILLSVALLLGSLIYLCLPPAAQQWLSRRADGR